MRSPPAACQWTDRSITGPYPDHNQPITESRFMFDFVSFLVISYLCKIDSKCSVVSGSLSDSILLVLVVFFAQKSDFEQLLLPGRQHFAALFLYPSLNIILSNFHPNKLEFSETLYFTYPFGYPNVFHAKNYYLFVY